MKRILVVALFALMGMSALALAQQGTTQGEPAKTGMSHAGMAKTEAAAKPVTMTGEVVDLYCYMGHGATGPDHAKCANSCIKKGLPIGFLSSDGTLYVITGKDHESANTMVADFAGKKSTITGTVREQNGMKAIEIATIAEAKTETK